MDNFPNKMANSLEEIGNPGVDDYRAHKNEILESPTSKYILTEYIDRGTFGQVFKATHVNTGRPVAIKILTDDEDDRDLSKEEYILMEKLKNDNGNDSFIHVMADFFEHCDHPCLVFELLSMTLHRFLYKEYKRPLPIYGIRAILFQLITALAKLKEHHVVHADLKLENIMLVDHDKYPYFVKVIDFGSAEDTKNIKDTTYVQTRFYRAPEILMGCNYDESIDMWSVGCVMAGLLLVNPIFPGLDEYEQLSFIIKLQGMPPEHMFNKGRKVSKYFVSTTDENKTKTWKLKSEAEFYGSTVPVPPDFTVVKPTKSMLEKNLDHWGIPENEFVEQLVDFIEYMDFLEMALKIDPFERITPNAALDHSFLNFSFYITKNCQYWKRSFEVMPPAYRITHISDDRSEHPDILGENPTDSSNSQKCPNRESSPLSVSSWFASQTLSVNYSDSTNGQNVDQSVPGDDIKSLKFDEGSKYPDIKD